MNNNASRKIGNDFEITVADKVTVNDVSLIKYKLLFYDGNKEYSVYSDLDFLSEDFKEEDVRKYITERINENPDEKEIVIMSDELEVGSSGGNNFPNLGLNPELWKYMKLGDYMYTLNEGGVDMLTEAEGILRSSIGVLSISLNGRGPSSFMSKLSSVGSLPGKYSGILGDINAFATNVSNKLNDISVNVIGWIGNVSAIINNDVNSDDFSDLDWDKDLFPRVINGELSYGEASFILQYGEEEGARLWDEYVEKNMPLFMNAEDNPNFINMYQNTLAGGLLNVAADGTTYLNTTDPNYWQDFAYYDPEEAWAQHVEAFGKTRINLINGTKDGTKTLYDYTNGMETADYIYNTGIWSADDVKTNINNGTGIFTNIGDMAKGMSDGVLASTSEDALAYMKNDASFHADVASWTLVCAIANVRNIEQPDFYKSIDYVKHVYNFQDNFYRSDKGQNALMEYWIDYAREELGMVYDEAYAWAKQFYVDFVMANGHGYEWCPDDFGIINEKGEVRGDIINSYFYTLDSYAINVSDSDKISEYETYYEKNGRYPEGVVYDYFNKKYYLLKPNEDALKYSPEGFSDCLQWALYQLDTQFNGADGPRFCFSALGQMEAVERNLRGFGIDEEEFNIISLATNKINEGLNRYDFGGRYSGYKNGTELLMDTEFLTENKEQIMKDFGINVDDWQKLWDISVDFSKTNAGLASVVGSSAYITAIQVALGVRKFFENVNDFRKTIGASDQWQAIKADGDPKYWAVVDEVYSVMSYINEEFEEYKKSPEYASRFNDFHGSNECLRRTMEYFNFSFYKEEENCYVIDGKTYYSYDLIPSEIRDHYIKIYESRAFEDYVRESWGNSGNSSTSAYNSAFIYGVRHGGDFTLFNSLSPELIEFRNHQQATMNDVSIDKTGEYAKNEYYDVDLYKDLEAISWVKHDNFLGLAANQVGTMAIPIGLSLIPGFTGLGTAVNTTTGVVTLTSIGKAFQAASSAALWISAFGGASEEAFANGATYGQAFGYATLSATTELAIEWMFGGMQGTGIGIGAFDDIVNLGVNKIFGNVDSKSFRKLLRRFIISSFGEGVEEVVTDGITPLWQSITYMNDKTWGELARENVDLKSLTRTFVISFLSSILFTGLGVINDKRTDGRRFDVVYKNMPEDFRNMINESPEMQNIIKKIRRLYMSELNGMNSSLTAADVLNRIINYQTNEFLSNPQSANQLAEIQQKLTDLANAPVAIQVGVNEEITLRRIELLQLERQLEIEGIIVEDGVAWFETDEAKEKFFNSIYEYVSGYYQGTNENLRDAVRRLQQARESGSVDLVSSAVNIILSNSQSNVLNSKTVLFEVNGQKIKLPAFVVEKLSSNVKILEDGTVQFNKDMTVEKFLDLLYKRAIKISNEQLKTTENLEVKQKLQEKIKKLENVTDKNNIELINTAIQTITADEFINSDIFKQRTMVTLEVNGEMIELPVYVVEKLSTKVKILKDGTLEFTKGMTAEKLLEILYDRAIRINNDLINKNNYDLGKMDPARNNKNGKNNLINTAVDLIKNTFNGTNFYITNANNVEGQNLISYEANVNIDGENHVVNVYVDNTTNTDVYANEDVINRIKRKVYAAVGKNQQNVYVGEVSIDKIGNVVVNQNNENKAYVDSLNGVVVSGAGAALVGNATTGANAANRVGTTTNKANEKNTKTDSKKVKDTVVEQVKEPTKAPARLTIPELKTQMESYVESLKKEFNQFIEIHKNDPDFNTKLENFKTEKTNEFSIKLLEAKGSISTSYSERIHSMNLNIENESVESVKENLIKQRDALVSEQANEIADFEQSVKGKFNEVINSFDANSITNTDNLIQNDNTGIGNVAAVASNNTGVVTNNNTNVQQELQQQQAEQRTSDLKILEESNMPKSIAGVLTKDLYDFFTGNKQIPGALFPHMTYYAKLFSQHVMDSNVILSENVMSKLEAVKDLKNGQVVVNVFDFYGQENVPAVISNSDTVTVDGVNYSAYDIYYATTLNSSANSSLLVNGVHGAITLDNVLKLASEFKKLNPDLNINEKAVAAQLKAVSYSKWILEDVFAGQTDLSVARGNYYQTYNYLVKNGVSSDAAAQIILNQGREILAARGTTVIATTNSGVNIRAINNCNNQNPLLTKENIQKIMERAEKLYGKTGLKDIIIYDTFSPTNLYFQVVHYKQSNPFTAAAEASADTIYLWQDFTDISEITHEYGHTIDPVIGENGIPFSQSEAYSNAIKADEGVTDKRITDYAYSNNQEDFAEFIRFFELNPVEMALKYPNRYIACKNAGVNLEISMGAIFEYIGRTPTIDVLVQLSQNTGINLQEFINGFIKGENVNPKGNSIVERVLNELSNIYPERSDILSDIPSDLSSYSKTDVITTTNATTESTFFESFDVAPVASNKVETQSTEIVDVSDENNTTSQRQTQPISGQPVQISQATDVIPNKTNNIEMVDVGHKNYIEITKDVHKYLTENSGTDLRNDSVLKEKVKNLYVELTKSKPKALDSIHKLLNQHMSESEASSLMTEIGRELLSTTTAIDVISDIEINADLIKSDVIDLIKRLKKGNGGKIGSKLYERVNSALSSLDFTEAVNSIKIEIAKDMLDSNGKLTPEMKQKIKESISKVIVYKQLLKQDIGDIKIVIRNQESPSRFNTMFNSEYSLDTESGVIELWNGNISEQNIFNAFANLIFNKNARIDSTNFIENWSNAVIKDKTITSYDSLISIAHNFVETFNSIITNPSQYKDFVGLSKNDGKPLSLKYRIIREMFNKGDNEVSLFDGLMCQNGENISLFNHKQDINPDVTAESRNFDLNMEEVDTRYNYSEHHLIYGGLVLHDGAIYGAHSANAFNRFISRITTLNVEIHPSFRNVISYSYAESSNPKTVYKYSDKQFLNMYKYAIEKELNFIVEEAKDKKTEYVMLGNGLWVVRYLDSNGNVKSFFPIIKQMHSFNTQKTIPVPIKLTSNGEVKLEKINITVDNGLPDAVFTHGPKLIQVVRRIVGNSGVTSLNISQLQFNTTTESFDVVIKNPSGQTITIPNNVIMDSSISPNIKEFIDAYTNGEVIITGDIVTKEDIVTNLKNKHDAALQTRETIGSKNNTESQFKLETFDVNPVSADKIGSIETFNVVHENESNIEMMDESVNETEKVDDANVIENVDTVNLPASLSGVNTEFLLKYLNDNNSSLGFYTISDIKNALMELNKFVRENNIVLSDSVMSKLDILNNASLNGKMVLNFEEFIKGEIPIIIDSFVTLNDGTAVSTEVLIDILSMENDGYISLFNNGVYNGITINNFNEAVTELFKNSNEFKQKFELSYEKFNNSYIYEDGTLFPKQFSSFETKTLLEILKNRNKIKKYKGNERTQVINAINEFVEYGINNGSQIYINNKNSFKHLQKVGVGNKLIYEIKSKAYDVFKQNEKNGGSFGAWQGAIRETFNKVHMTEKLNKLLGNKESFNNIFNKIFSKNKVVDSNFMENLSLNNISEEELINLIKSVSNGLFVNIEQQELYSYVEKIKEIYSGMNTKEALQVLYLLETYEVGAKGICNYASMTNLIFEHYIGNPVKFENDFGYPMYVTVNGKEQLNITMLMVDMYASINKGQLVAETNGIYKIVTSNQEYLNLATGSGEIMFDNLNKFLDAKNIKIDLKETFSYHSSSTETRMSYDDILKNIYEAIQRGDKIHISGKGFNLYYPNGKICVRNFEAHIMSLYGITADGKLIVDSFGKEIIIDLREILSKGANRQFDIVAYNVKSIEKIDAVNNNLSEQSKSETYDEIHENEVSGEMIDESAIAAPRNMYDEIRNFIENPNLEDVSRIEKMLDKLENETFKNDIKVLINELNKGNVVINPSEFIYNGENMLVVPKKVVDYYNENNPNAVINLQVLYDLALLLNKDLFKLLEPSFLSNSYSYFGNVNTNELIESLKVFKDALNAANVELNNIVNQNVLKAVELINDETLTDTELIGELSMLNIESVLPKGYDEFRNIIKKSLYSVDVAIKVLESKNYSSTEIANILASYAYLQKRMRATDSIYHKAFDYLVKNNIDKSDAINLLRSQAQRIINARGTSLLGVTATGVEIRIVNNANGTMVTEEDVQFIMRRIENRYKKTDLKQIIIYDTVSPDDILWENDPNYSKTGNKFTSAACASADTIYLWGVMTDINCVVHEYGHTLDRYLAKYRRNYYFSDGSEYSNAILKDNKITSSPITDYAKINNHEDFAEFIEHFEGNQVEMGLAYPNRYMAIHNADVNMRIDSSLIVEYINQNNVYEIFEKLSKILSQNEKISPIELINDFVNGKEINTYGNILVEDILNALNSKYTNRSDILTEVPNNIDTSFVTSNDNVVYIEESSNTDTLSPKANLPKAANIDTGTKTIPSTIEVNGVSVETSVVTELIEDGSKLIEYLNNNTPMDVSNMKDAIIEYIDYAKANNVELDLSENIMKYYDAIKYAKANNLHILNETNIIENGTDAFIIKDGLYRTCEWNMLYKGTLDLFAKGMESLEVIEENINGTLFGYGMTDFFDLLIKGIDQKTLDSSQFKSVVEIVSKINFNDTTNNGLVVYNVHDVVFNNALPIYLTNKVNGIDTIKLIEYITEGKVLDKNYTVSELREAIAQLNSEVRASNLKLSDALMEKLDVIENANSNRKIVLNINEFITGEAAIIVDAYITLEDGTKIKTESLYEVLKMENKSYITALNNGYDGLNKDNLSEATEKLFEMSPELKQQLEENYKKLSNNYVYSDGSLIPKQFLTIKTETIIDIFNNPNKIDSYEVKTKENIIKAINEFVEYLKNNGVAIESSHQQAIEFVNRKVPKVDSSIAIKSKAYDMFKRNQKNGGTFGTNQGAIRDIFNKIGLTDKLNSLMGKQISSKDIINKIIFGKQKADTDFLKNLVYANLSEEELKAMLLKQSRSLFVSVEQKQLNEYISRIQEIYPNMSTKDAIHVLYLLETYEAGGTGICNYASMVNLIFEHYVDNPAKFESDLGYPMYVEVNGKQQLNTTMLLVDLFASINKGHLVTETNGVYNIATSNSKYLNLATYDGKIVIEHLNRFLNEKNITIDYEIKFEYISHSRNLMHYEEVITEVNRAIQRGEKIHISSGGFNLYYPNGKLCSKNVGGHIMSVLGITKDGNLIVDSWGQELILNLKEAMSNSGNPYTTRSGKTYTSFVQIVAYDVKSIQKIDGTNNNVNTETTINNNKHNSVEQTRLEVFDVEYAHESIAVSDSKNVITDTTKNTNIHDVITNFKNNINNIGGELYNSSDMPLSDNPSRRKVQEKMLRGETLTMLDKVSGAAGRDMVIRNLGDYQLKSDHCYRAISVETLNKYIEKGYIEGFSEYLGEITLEDGTKKLDNGGVDWYLGGASKRYGSVIIECPADKRYFVPTHDHGLGMAQDVHVRHMKSSGKNNPIPFSMVTNVFYLN